jgi:hypothetical protein
MDWWDTALIGVGAGMLCAAAERYWQKGDRSSAAIHGAVSLYFLWLTLRGFFLAFRP